jgi:Uma2 family endonuclease
MTTASLLTAYPSDQYPDQRSERLDWHRATWDDYLHYRDAVTPVDRRRLFFNDGFLKVDDMGWEGIDHAQIRDLFVMLLGLWYMAHPDETAQSMGGCLMEKKGQQAAVPDLLLYVGPDAPRWTKGEPRRIDLDRWRVPDLVGEVADTTLATDLDEMKQLHTNLKIPEYWVINIRGRQVLMFRLQNGQYQQCQQSSLLSGLTVDQLEEALERSVQGTNVGAAGWFMQTLMGGP